MSEKKYKKKLIILSLIFLNNLNLFYEFLSNIKNFFMLIIMKEKPKFILNMYRDFYIFFKRRDWAKGGNTNQ